MYIFTQKYTKLPSKKTYVGAIYFAYNNKISRQTKHVDTKSHFVWCYVENGMIKIIFVQSEDKDADVFTKNT